MSTAARRAALGALLLCSMFAADALAEPIIDPIVRVREGGDSIPITGLPFTYDFGAFPGDPDGSGIDCFTGTDSATELPLVACSFQNLTGRTIALIDLFFAIPPDPGPLAFFIEDPDGLFGRASISPAGALFAGGRGISSAVCDGDSCFGGEFVIELVGFPSGTGITVTIAAPEPGVLGLLAVAAVFAGLRRRRGAAQH